MATAGADTTAMQHTVHDLYNRTEMYSTSKVTTTLTKKMTKYAR